MADKKISALTAATTPLAGTEVLPIVQSGATVKVANNDLRPKQIQSNATSGVLQVVGPAAAATRVMTTPDANFTAARTDAAQSFTGDQTLSTGNLIAGTSGKGIADATSAVLLGFTPLKAELSGAPFVEGKSAGGPTYGVISDNRYIGPNTATDFFSVVLSDNYSAALIELCVSGRGSNGANFYFQGHRYVVVNNGSSIGTTTVGTDQTSGNITFTLTWTATNTFKITFTQTQTGVNFFGVVTAILKAAGGGDNTAGTIATLTYL